MHGTIHGPGYSGGESIGGSDQLSSGDFAGDFHVYGAIWSRDQIQFLVDDRPYFTVKPSDIPAGKEWVYHLPFFLLLNVAVGGATSWPGAPDATTVFPRDMRVDHVRVYQQPRRLFHRQ